jgi:UPF0716 protein FxsA
MLPGFITDAIGFALLVPGLRRALIRRYIHLMPAQGEVVVRREVSERRTIEGDWRRED